jgi:hypothetical protein
MPRATCAAHRMLSEDQRALDGLLFERYIANRLKREEFSGSSTLIESLWSPARPHSVHAGRPRPGVRPVLASVVLLVLGAGLLRALNVWLFAADPSASLIAAWMSLGLLLMACGAIGLGLARVNDRLEPRGDAAPTGAQYEPASSESTRHRTDAIGRFGGTPDRVDPPTH